jgi:hypothetical protein
MVVVQGSNYYGPPLHIHTTTWIMVWSFGLIRNTCFKQGHIQKREFHTRNQITFYSNIKERTDEGNSKWIRKKIIISRTEFIFEENVTQPINLNLHILDIRNGFPIFSINANIFSMHAYPKQGRVCKQQMTDPLFSKFHLFQVENCLLFGGFCNSHWSWRLVWLGRICFTFKQWHHYSVLNN